MEELEAEKFAEKILALDDKVILAGVVDERGDVIGGKVNEAYKSRFSDDKKDWELIGSRAAVIMGAVRASDGVLSDIESIVSIRKDSKQLLSWIPDKRVIVAAILPRSVDSGSMSEKIRHLFGL